MPPKITIVRHGQGYHNVTRNYNIRDPLLTPLGHEQCARLSASYPHHKTVDLLIASPLRRTIQTAAFSFGPALARPDVPFVLDPKLQELDKHDSDRGLDVPDLKMWLEETEKGGEGKVAFDWGKIDASCVHEGYNNKEDGYYAYETRAIYNRAADMRASLFLRPNSHIILVTHGAIAHFLTEDWDIADPHLGTNWSNCEVRDFVFSNTSTESDAHLVETKESRARRPPYEGLKWEVPWERSGEKDEHVAAEVEGLKE